MRNLVLGSHHKVIVYSGLINEGVAEWQTRRFVKPMAKGRVGSSPTT